MPPPVLTGLVGSALVAVGGLGAGALPGDRTWFGLSLPRGVGTGLVVLGVVVLCASWWRLRPHDDGDPRPVLRAAALWSLPLLVAPPLFSRDVWAYAGQASVAALGGDPYAGGPELGDPALAREVDDVWRGTPSPYGPAFLAPAAAVVRASGGALEPTVLGLRLLAVLGLLLTAWALMRLRPTSRTAWLGVANPLGLLHGVAGAHNDALMVGLLVAGLALGAHYPRARRLVAAGAVVALGALVKAPALVALPALVLAQPGWPARLRAAALTGGGAAGAAGLVALGTGLGWGWVAALDSGRTLPSLFSPATGLATALGAAVRGVGAADSTAAVRDPVLDAFAVLAVLAGAVVLLLAARLGAVRACGLALLTLVLLSPTVLPWYPLWAVVPLAAVAGRREAAALGGACLVLCLLTWPSGRSVVRPPLFGLPLAAAGVAAAVAVRAEDRAGTRRPAANT